MKYNKYVKVWLILGCVLLFFQIFIGGITRITGSGLSITKWEVVRGSIPPLNDAEWIGEFDLYKVTPQYEKINDGMSLSEFKFIYFWEFFHRFWARVMGFTFIFPFIFFILKRWVDKKMIKQLSLVFLGAMMAAVFGWFMVASGLIDRPWVNAYKLSMHLGIALVTLCFLLWATFMAFDVKSKSVNNKKIFNLALLFISCLILQIFFGAIISGMRAALYYPSWPDMNGQYIPEILGQLSEWRLENLVDYDKNSFMPALIHVLHRNWGYVVYGLGMFLGFKILRYPLRSHFYMAAIMLMVLLNLQVLLGILTLINSKGAIPLSYAIMHQAVAIVLLGVSLYNIYVYKIRLD